MNHPDRAAGVRLVTDYPGRTMVPPPLTVDDEFARLSREELVDIVKEQNERIMEMQERLDIIAALEDGDLL